MTSVWTLLIAALPLLVLSSEFKQCSFLNQLSYKPPVLDSLQCYNDYTSLIRCTWEEDPHAPLHLVIKPVDGEPESECLPDGHYVRLSNGRIRRSCVYKTPVFYLGQRDVYFNISCPSKAATLNIAQKGKFKSPVNLRESKVAGGRLLSWSSPYFSSSRLTDSLTYEVQYKRHGDDWTVVSDINSTEKVITEQPGSSYEARVRARGRVGLWSDWSHPVTWVAEQEDDFNLQCTIEEIGVLCNWQVKREHAQVLSFYLCSQTNGSNTSCELCVNPSNQPHHDVLDFSCWLYALEPDMLTVELKSVHYIKEFANQLNIQLPRLPPMQLSKEDGIWTLSWSRPNIAKSVTFSYEVRLQNNDTKDYKMYTLSDGDVSLPFPSSTLLPTTTYIAEIRALPIDIYSGRPSDWSEPVYFTSNSASYIATIIYILVAVFVAVFFIILYNALPACHRKVVLWKVSIPSPIKSRVLEEMSKKSSPISWGNLYSENEKTSVCIMQPSDNPIIYKGSILECPLLPYSDDSLTKSEWMHELDKSSSYIEGSGISVKSAMSFTGPYILCQQDSSSQTETLDTSFYSGTTFDEDSRSITEDATDCPTANGGYVSSPPTSLTSTEHPTMLNNPANEHIPEISQLHHGNPPAYTPNPTVMPGVLFSNRSGYCLMPSMDINVAAWVQASAPPPGGDMESQSKDVAEGGQSARGYVTLSQNAT
ncbi:hypothetical protein NFI96_011121 [Prochilodus magdalenae]|nr:hypothetical protein NFI96_011121 [Prochilodus magdalenae]